MDNALFLLLMLFLANVAWISDKWLGLIASRVGKAIWQRFAEILVTYFMTIVIAVAVENSVMGQVWKQGWEFYAVTFALFIVLSAPGFIYRLLWK